jgi:hypothetical protein
MLARVGGGIADWSYTPLPLRPAIEPELISSHSALKSASTPPASTSFSSIPAISPSSYLSSARKPTPVVRRNVITAWDCLGSSTYARERRPGDVVCMRLRARLKSWHSMKAWPPERKPSPHGHSSAAARPLAGSRPGPWASGGNRGAKALVCRPTCSRGGVLGSAAPDGRPGVPEAIWNVVVA